MPYVIALTVNNPADLLPSFARLKAGGFHPFIANFHHGTIAAGYVIALGGFNILLPENEIEDARLWMSVDLTIEDYDPIIKRSGRDIFQASVLSMNPLFIAYCLSPTLLICLFTICIFLLYALGFRDAHWLILSESSTLCIIGILAHARHMQSKE